MKVAIQGVIEVPKSMWGPLPTGEEPVTEWTAGALPAGKHKVNAAGLEVVVADEGHCGVPARAEVRTAGAQYVVEADRSPPKWVGKPTHHRAVQASWRRIHDHGAMRDHAGHVNCQSAPAPTCMKVGRCGGSAGPTEQRCRRSSCGGP